MFQFQNLKHKREYLKVATYPKKTISNKYQKPTDVTYKLIDSKKKELTQPRNNLLPYYPKETLFAN